MKDRPPLQPPAELLRNPHPHWKRGRSECPVEERSAFGATSYFVLRRADVEAALRDAETFSSSINQQTMGPYMGELILAMDGHEHSQYRALVSHAFRRSSLERWERELVRPLMAELVAEIAPRGRADLVRDVTSQYPVKVIAGIVGVPVSDHAKFHEWAEQINTGPMNPEQGLAASRAMREYLEPLVEETLRWETSVTMVNRVTTRDTEMAGCPVAKGSSIILLTSSSNRDESVYPYADAWRLEREIEPPHLAFGWGRHLCLGMHLARLELSVGLETLLDRLPNLRLDPDEEPPEIVGYAFRGPERLPVVFDPS